MQRLRWDKVSTIVRKELAEYRKNRYILISLFVMPLLMSVVLPLVYLVPIAALAEPPNDQPLELRIAIDVTVVDLDIVNASFQNARLTDCALTNCALSQCELFNCTVDSCVVGESNITSSMVQSSILARCNVLDSTTVNSLAPGSVFLGVESESETYLKLFVNLLLMFFVLIPTIIPTVIASYSFVGEKLSRSLEPLLATPTSDLELLVGKTVAIFLPTMVVTWVSLVPTVIIVDLVTSPILGYYPLPNDVWVVGVFLLGPLFCVLSVLINVIISSKVTDVRSSQQIGGVIVLPAIAFFVVSLIGVVVLTIANMLIFSALILLLDLGVLYVALRSFRREDILVRWR